MSLHVLGPYLLEKLLGRLEQICRADDQLQQGTELLVLGHAIS